MCRTFEFCHSPEVFFFSNILLPRWRPRKLFFGERWNLKLEFKQRTWILFVELPSLVVRIFSIFKLEVKNETKKDRRNFTFVYGSNHLGEFFCRADISRGIVGDFYVQCMQIFRSVHVSDCRYAFSECPKKKSIL